MTLYVIDFTRFFIYLPVNKQDNMSYMTYSNLVMMALEGNRENRALTRYALDG